MAGHAAAGLLLTSATKPARLGRKVPMGDGTVLCAAAILLLAVMVVGHTMWVVAAWLLRALSGGPEPLRPSEPPRAIVPPTGLADELRITAEQVKRLAQRGALS